MRSWIACSLLPLLIASSIVREVGADISLPSIFSDHMVLQRDAPLPIWGQGAAGEEVTVSFAEQAATTTANDEGRWSVSLDALEASSEPRQLIVKGNNTITIEDVLVGEVWLGSGQSNMEWNLANTDDHEAEIAAANHPQLRLFLVPKVQAAEPALDVDATWKVCTPEAATNFSAVSYFFSRQLHEELGVPVGMIASSWGGSRIEPWTPTAEPQEGYSGMYNAMIAPLKPFAIRGAIWYQGESNVNDEGNLTYRDKMEALIGGWRRVWNQDELPFYFVQIAPFKDFYKPEMLPRLWHDQARALKIPYTGMAVVTDVGNIDDIHPRNKLDVGRRLALWALAKDYGRDDLVYSGPLYKSMQIEGDKIRLSFAHVGGGLVARDGEPLSEFQISAKDVGFVPAEATIDGDTVVVYANQVNHPQHVRFAWHKLSNANLSNKEGLPAAPFTTENWQGGSGE